MGNTVRALLEVGWGGLASAEEDKKLEALQDSQ